MKTMRFIALAMTLLTVNIAFAADEIHWTVTGQDSVCAATTVIDLRDPGCGNAQKVATALGFQPKWWRLPLGSVAVPATRADLDSSRYLEARLIVGKDFRRFFPKVAVLR